MGQMCSFFMDAKPFDGRELVQYEGLIAPFR